MGGGSPRGMERAKRDEYSWDFLRLNLIYCARRNNRVDRYERKKLEIFFFFFFLIPRSQMTRPYTIIQLIRRRIDKRIAPIIGNNRGLTGLAPDFSR